jgi:LPXTG-site transpeptidase (sortase) family protein
VGHVDSRTGPAVFYRLQELRPGDEIQVMNADNQVVRFQVEQLRQVAKDNFPTEMVYGMTPEPTLRLITCGGVFDSASRSYRDNVIVFASRLEG